MQTIKKSKTVKAMVLGVGFKPAKYHEFIGGKKDTYKFYACTPNNNHIALLNEIMARDYILGVAKRVCTDRHPNGFLEVVIYK